MPSRTPVPSNTPVPTPTPSARFRRVDLPVTDMLYDPTSGLIWASVESLGARAETITTIEPVSGAIGDSVYLGSHPGPIAVSDDGQFVYAALDVSGEIARVTTATMAVDLTFPLGVDPYFNALYGAQLRVVPGEPHALAVSMRFDPRTSPPYAGLAVFDDGVRRLRALSFSQPAANVIAFSDSPSMLYSYDNEDTGADFLGIAVTADGLEIQTFRSTLEDNAPFPEFMFDMVYDAGLLYGTSGDVYDPAADVVRGRYDYGAHCRLPPCGCVVPDAAAGRVYFLTADDTGNDVIKVFDQPTFRQIASYPVPGIRYEDTFVDVCLRWGGKGFAFEATEHLADNTRTDYVVLVDLP